MTTTKKRLIKIIVVIVVIFITIVSIILINNNHNKQCKFINYPTNYSICNTQDFEVIIYSDRNDLECFKEVNIESAILEDLEKNIYHVKINDIEERDKTFIEEEYYFPYYFNLTMSFKSDSMVNMSDVKLIINLKNGENISFNIGNISVINYEFIQLFDTKSVTSMTKKVEEYYTLDTITVELYNKQYSNIILNNIILVSNVVKTASDVINIEVGENYLLDIKLDYLEDSFIDHVGIILELEFNGNIHRQLISPYRLFKTTSKHTEPFIQKYEIY